MNMEELQNTAYDIFERFTKENPTCGQGAYLSKQTNRVLAFEKYFNALNFADIRVLCGRPLQGSEIRLLRGHIKSKIEKYLADNVKTLALC
jgi:hypothetical protein